MCDIDECSEYLEFKALIYNKHSQNTCYCPDLTNIFYVQKC